MCLCVCVEGRGVFSKGCKAIPQMLSMQQDYQAEPINRNQSLALALACTHTHTMRAHSHANSHSCSRADRLRFLSAPHFHLLPPRKGPPRSEGQISSKYRIVSGRSRRLPPSLPTKQAVRPFPSFSRQLSQAQGKAKGLRASSAAPWTAPPAGAAGRQALNDGRRR